MCTTGNVALCCAHRYGLEEAQPSSSVGADAPGAAADSTPADAAGDEADGDTAGEQQQGGGRRHVPAAQRRAARKQVCSFRVDNSNSNFKIFT